MSQTKITKQNCMERFNMSAFNKTYYYDPVKQRLSWLEVDYLGRNDLFPPHVRDCAAYGIDEARRVAESYGGTLTIGYCKQY